MYLIGISSNCYGAGKTTLARNLVGIINSLPDMRNAASIVSFASPIKSCAMSMIERVAGGGPFDKTEVVFGKDVTYRDILLGVGQLARSWDQDFWLKAALREMETRSSAAGGPDIFIIDDMRFPNEFDYIRNHGINGGGSATVYLMNEAYSGAAQNEAEGLLNPAFFDITVIRGRNSADADDSMKNARMIFSFIRDDIADLREKRISKVKKPEYMEII